MLDFGWIRGSQAHAGSRVRESKEVSTTQTLLRVANVLSGRLRFGMGL